MKKTAVEILLVKAEMTELPEKRLLISRNLGCVDLIWPKSGTAKKSAAREFVYRKGKCDFQDEIWAKRCIFREEIDDHCGIAVSITEPVTLQKIRKILQATAKYALKQSGDVVAGFAPGYGDIASAPFDAMAAMVAEKDAPKAIAQGVVDFNDLPAAGESVTVTITLKRPKIFDREVGSLTLEIRNVG